MYALQEGGKRGVATGVLLYWLTFLFNVVAVFIFRQHKGRARAIYILLSHFRGPAIAVPQSAWGYRSTTTAPVYLY